MASSGAFWDEFVHWTGLHNVSLISKSSVRITRETYRWPKIEGFGGRPLLVGGLGPGPPGPSPKSGTASLSIKRCRLGNEFREPLSDEQAYRQSRSLSRPSDNVVTSIRVMLSFSHAPSRDSWVTTRCMWEWQHYSLTILSQTRQGVSK